MSTLLHAPLIVRFRGVRGSIPSPGPATMRYGGNTSCVELRCGKTILILDAGTGIRALGNDLIDEFGTAPITANLLITHVHWDHIQGFPFFAPLYHPRHWVRVFAAPGHRTRVEEGLRNQMQSTHFPVYLDRMHGLSGIEELDTRTTTIGPFTVRALETNHPGGCAAFHISVGDASIVYAPDHEPDCNVISGPPGENAAHVRRQSFVDFIREVDLLILDTQYTAAEYSNCLGWGHGSLPESVALAMEGNVKRLALFHHDPSHNDDEIDDMLEAARGLASESQLHVFAAIESEAMSIETGCLSTAGLAAGQFLATV